MQELNQQNTSIDILPLDFGKRISELEKTTNMHPNYLAAQICYDRFGTCFWDRFFLNNLDPIISQEIAKNGLSTHDSSRVSARGTNYYWLHFLSPIAAYGRQNRTINIAKKILKLDPGINVKEISKQLPSGMEYSFWYSIGGNMLQDSITGLVDEQEYRANILGLHAVETFHSNPSLKLSHLIEEAKRAEILIVDGGYRESFYYKLAKIHIKPLYGNIILKNMIKLAPFLTYSGIGIIPLELN